MLKEEVKAYMAKPLEWFGKVTVEMLHKIDVMKNSTHKFIEVEPEHAVRLARVQQEEAPRPRRACSGRGSRVHRRG